jgi:hypothetical protein
VGGMSNKIHRHEVFSSPEIISNKHQRINTDQKAPNMTKYSSNQQSPSHLPASSSSSISSPKIREIYHSIVNYIDSSNSIPSRSDKKDKDIRTIFTICPIGASHITPLSPDLMTLNPSYDHSLFQTLQLFNSKYCPPDRHSSSSPLKLQRDLFGERVSYHPLLFYNIAWYLCCCHACPPLQETLNQLFHQFVTHYSLDSPNPTSNQISSLTQIELATFLLFLSWNDHAASYLTERQALEVIINGILSALHAAAKKPHRVFPPTPLRLSLTLCVDRRC